jgi:hypothetical protein
MSNDDNRNFFSDMWNKATSEQYLPYVMLGLIVLIVVFLGTVWVVRKYNKPPTPIVTKEETRGVLNSIYNWRLTTTIVLFIIWLLLAAIFVDPHTLKEGTGDNATTFNAMSLSSGVLACIFNGPLRIYFWICGLFHSPVGTYLKQAS